MAHTSVLAHVPFATKPAEPSPVSPDGHGLAELAHMAVSGQLAAAELELHQWQRRADCPPAARVMLAGLLARRGELAHARTVLAHVPSEATASLHPAEAKLTITLLTRLGEHDRARQVTHRLHAAWGDRPAIRRWLGDLEAPGAEALPAEPEARVEHLAGELAADPDVIPSLVQAQTYSPDQGEIDLLRHALNRLAPALDDDRHLVPLCRGQARLSLLAGDPDEARRWAHRGLKRAPADEKLALMLAEVDDEPTVGPPARDVLGRVVEARPQYPDVRRAWIRRHARDGQSDSARQLLADWLSQEPDSPIALALDKELAA